MAYIELHSRSAFSFLEGASVPEELASRCADYEMPAMALLDRNGFYGSPRFHLGAKKVSVRAHVGAEVASPEGWCYPLLVESRAGYQNLCRLITQMKMRGRKAGTVPTLDVEPGFSPASADVAPTLRSAHAGLNRLRKN